MTNGALSGEDDLRRELWALGLLALALLLALSFVPPWWLGDLGRALFPGDNIVGVVGHWVHDSAWAFFGLPAFLLPLLPTFWALYAVRRLDRQEALRLTGFLAGVLVLVPVGIYAYARPAGPLPAAVGWLGPALGQPLTAVLGWLGAGLLVTFAFAALCVATLRWNPLRSAAGGGLAAWARARRAAAVGVERASRFRRPTPADTLDLADEGETDGEWADLDATLPFPSDPAVAQPPGAGGATRLAASAPRSHKDVVTDVVGPETLPLGADDLPPTDLLAPVPARDEAGNRRALDGLGQVLIDKLATFKVSGEIVGMTTGPVVTQFEVSPAPGIKVARIANLDADLALALRAPSVRIVAPIPGKAAVGVEVPNPEPQVVYFREVLESTAFRRSRAQLPIALGQDLGGQPYVADLAKMPHLLIAGATGSGKSVCINTIITSLIYRYSPRMLRLLMVDPKMVELSMYNDLPHLRHPVVTDHGEAAGVLKWAVLEMERRYQLLSANNVRNLQDFNRRLAAGHPMRSHEPHGEEGDPDRWLYTAGPLPYIVLIIDELADLMMTAAGEVEKPLALLAQKARAIGIHLILATQRPSVNVITGLIKANFPSRIAFRVSSKVDSRTILDQNGADSLLGNGDMLFLPPGQSDPLRLQGAYLSTEETERLMRWYRDQARLHAEQQPTEHPPLPEEDILDVVRAREADSDSRDLADEVLEDRDELFREAAELCIQQQGGSTSLLQRRLRIGYGRAARIIDQLHHAGILGPPDGSKPREVLVDLVQLDQFFPQD